VPIVVDLHQKKVEKVPTPGFIEIFTTFAMFCNIFLTIEGFYSAVVHDVVNKSYLLVCSSPAVPPTLVSTHIYIRVLFEKV
jgi:hypothetical protein